MLLLGRVKRILGALRAAPVELPVREAYARWAPSYPAEAHGGYMAVEQEAMLRLLPDLTGAVVLDLACGTGRYAKLAPRAAPRRRSGWTCRRTCSGGRASRRWRWRAAI